jgi:hypothetical protein
MLIGVFSLLILSGVAMYYFGAEKATKKTSHN